MIVNIKTLLCIINLLLCPSVLSKNVPSTISDSTIPLDRENKIIKKFSVQIPASARIKIKLKQPKSGHTNVFIDIPSIDIKSFKESLDKIPYKRNRRVVVSGSGYGIGSVPGAGEWPHDFLEHIKKTYSASFWLLGYISFIKQIESGDLVGAVEDSSYLVIFADKERGLVWLSYKL